jgi:hypothetical protein
LGKASLTIIVNDWVRVGLAMSALLQDRTVAGTVVSFEDAAERLRHERELRAEAIALSEAHGRNAYTEFLLKQGRRPDRVQAAAIGRLMGVQVRAADGSLQPRLTKGEKAARRQGKTRKRKESDGLEHILRLRCALVNLAENHDDPADVIHYIDPVFDDVTVIREHLAHAVQWINRFAEEWNREQETRGCPRPV